MQTYGRGDVAAHARSTDRAAAEGCMKKPRRLH